MKISKNGLNIINFLIFNILILNQDHAIKSASKIRFPGSIEIVEAASEGDKEKVKSLIKSKANVNAVDEYKWTPITKAAYWGRTEVVEILLKAKANIELNNSSALTCAITHQREETIKLLVKNKADVNFPCYRDRATPFMHAVIVGNRDIVQILLDSGADLDKVNKEGKKAIAEAREAIPRLPERAENIKQIINILENESVARLTKKIIESEKSIILPIAKIIVEYAYCETIDIPKEAVAKKTGKASKCIIS